MQPILRQVPPSVPHISTQAVLRPNWAAPIAAIDLFYEAGISPEQEGRFP